MQKSYGYFLAAVLFVGSGCASVTRYSYRSSLPPDKHKAEDIVAAAASVLQDQGFTLTIANEKLGLVSTDWKSLTSDFSKGMQIFLAGSANTRKMKLSIAYLAAAQQLKITPTVENQSSSLYGAGAATEVTMNEEEKKFVNKVGGRILELLSMSPDSLEVFQEDQRMQ